MNTSKSFLKLCFMALFLLMYKNAMAVPITLTPDGTVDGTLVFTGDLTGLGLTEVGSITVVDDGTPIGGADGIFSGFDLDAIFLQGNRA